MTDTSRVTIDVASAAGVHAMEIWGRDAVDRLTARLGFALPPAGRTAGDDGLRAIRVEPATWLLDGANLDPARIAQALGDDGALTAIGGGLVRVRIGGPDWRALLMADGLFDAEDPAFGPLCAAATLIAHVAVRLHVIDDQTCEAFVPASFATGLLSSWSRTARQIAGP